MVSIRKTKQTGSRFQLRRKGRRGGVYDKEKVGLIVAGLCIGIFGVFLYSVAFSESSSVEPRGVLESLRKTKQHPVLVETTEDGDGDALPDPNHPPVPHHRKIVPMGDGMNAIALDIVSTLDCVTLLEEAEKSIKQGYSFGGDPFHDAMDDGIDGYGEQRQRRRLLQHGDDGGFADFGDNNKAEEQQQQPKEGEADDDFIPEEKWGDQAAGLGDQAAGGDQELNDGGGVKHGAVDDYMGVGDFYGGYFYPSAKHLFCLAASETPSEAITKEIKCDAGKKKRRTLLDLWSAARAQMSEELLLSVLDLAREQTETILGKSYNLWAPKGDEGLPYMVSTLNSHKDADNGGLDGLEESLGPGKIFIDVGSCLGLTCLVINRKYPGTKIVSLEPASPNWLLQELNLRCNLPKKELKKIKVILAGVGSNTDEEDDLMAKLMWRPSSTTSTRSWTPADEHKTRDVELTVRLRKLKSILAEADVIRPTHVDVMNLDCQGCEYNLIPALTKEEYEEIPTVMGEVHWGYINPSKLPSSERGKITHQRLCAHENIARGTKECCAFPDLTVKSSVPGEILQTDNDSKKFPPRESTVSDVIAENMCDDFSEWAKDHYLNDVPDDFNWFELSSQA